MLKKAMKIFAAAVFLLMGSLSSFSATAEQDIRVVVNGKTLDFEQPPIIVDGRTLVPLRGIAEELGASVEWFDNGADKSIKVSKNNKDAWFYIGKPRMQILTFTLLENGSLSGTGSGMIEIDVPPVIVGGRTLVPVRTLAEALECEVVWDYNMRRVIIREETE